MRQFREVPADPNAAEKLRAAEAKLNRLIEKREMYFAVRFMTLEEYRQMMETGVIPSKAKEVFIPNNSPIRSEPLSHPPVTFSQWLERSKQSWASTVWHQTNWDHSSEGLSAFSHLLHLLHEAHSEAIELDERKRAQVMIRLRDKIRNQLEQGARIFANIDNPLMAATRGKIKRVAENEDENILQRIRSFLDRPESTTPEDLRLIVQAISYHNRGDRDEFRQYHVAVIYNASMTSGTSWGNNAWSFINTERWGYPYSEVLAVIAILPDRHLIEELQLLNQQTEFAGIVHPIFDSNGIVRYPKT